MKLVILMGALLISTVIAAVLFRRGLAAAGGEAPASPSAGQAPPPAPVAGPRRPVPRFLTLPEQGGDPAARDPERRFLEEGAEEAPPEDTGAGPARSLAHEVAALGDALARRPGAAELEPLIARGLALQDPAVLGRLLGDRLSDPSARVRLALTEAMARSLEEGWSPREEVLRTLEVVSRDMDAAVAARAGEVLRSWSPVQ
jgi:hypothetical protein